MQFLSSVKQVFHSVPNTACWIDWSVRKSLSNISFHVVSIICWHLFTSSALLFYSQRSLNIYFYWTLIIKPLLLGSPSDEFYCLILKISFYNSPCVMSYSFRRVICSFTACTYFLTFFCGWMIYDIYISAKKSGDCISSRTRPRSIIVIV